MASWSRSWSSCCSRWMSVNTNPVLAPEYMCAAYAMERKRPALMRWCSCSLYEYTQLCAFCLKISNNQIKNAHFISYSQPQDSQNRKKKKIEFHGKPIVLSNLRVNKNTNQVDIKGKAKHLYFWFFSIYKFHTWGLTLGPPDQKPVSSSKASNTDSH